VVTRREEAREHVAFEAESLPAELVELKIVGESYRQDALRAIAGPKEPDGKELAVGATLRCEPSNAYDPNAIRVEVMGQLLGYVAREQALLLASAISRTHAGCIEVRGLIVGGWRDGASEGSYGIRVWLTTRDTDRLQVAPGVLDPAHRPAPVTLPPPPPAPAPRWSPPTLPQPQNDPQVESALDEFHRAAQAAKAAAKKTRTSRTPYRAPGPTDSEMRLVYSTTPTFVTGSAEFQEALKRQPPTIGRLVAQLIRSGERVEVQINGERVGYLTPKTSGKFLEVLRTAEAAGKKLTCAADLQYSEQGWKAVIHCQPELEP